MPEAHSKYSASGFEAAMLCPGKPVMETGLPNNGSAYAREGTAAHKVLELCLQESRRADAYEGRIIQVPIDGTDKTDPVLVDDEMVGHINWCLDTIAEYSGGEMVIAETQVNYAEAIGVEPRDGWGTADVIIARGDELIVMDLKYGRGVEVSAERNPQMMLYALGALAQCDGVLGDFTRVRVVVLQPRLSRSPSEWDCTVGELRQWAATEAWEAVEKRQRAEKNGDDPHASMAAWSEDFLSPGEKQCKFCRAKATCPALRETVAEHTGLDTASAADFSAGQPQAVGNDTDAGWLAACLSRADLIEDWIKAVRAEAERRLLDGADVPGYKLVAGKKGARQWADAKAAEEMLKTMRLKQEEMYDFSLISPTTADKLAKAKVIGPRQWPKLQELIVQREGKPHVAPVTDSRPALVRQPVAEMFDPADQSETPIA